MLAEIQCLPDPLGTPEHPYAHVDAAIAAIARASVRYEVGALGTTIEGDADVVWPLLRTVHDACLAAGAQSVVTIIKVASATDAEASPGIDDLTAAHREDASGAQA